MNKINFALVSIALAAAVQAEWNYSLTTDAAYYIKNEIKTGDEHFSKPNGAFDGLKAITRFDANYKLPTPLGNHWLLQDANLEFTASFELSPITVRPMIEFGFTPVPFLVFETGASIGSGWNMLGFEGLVQYDFNTADYEDLTPFAHYFYDLWVSGTFQFDTGALIKGDWSHMVMVASYKIYYEALTGIDDGEIWQWQESAGCANGSQYSITGLLGYQMPLTLNMIGMMANIHGHYDKDDYGKIAQSFDGDFITTDLSALFSFKVNEKNNLISLITFERARSFSTKHKDEDDEPLLHVKGGEWTFYRVAFSWTRKF